MEPRPTNQAEHTRATRDAYDRLAPVWSETTDAGPFNGHLERPALRSLVPMPLTGQRVLDAGCGSGAQCAWLLDEGADVIGTDVSTRMIEETRRRCGGRGRFFVADLAEPLEVEAASLDGITCSLVLHYLEDWAVPLRSFARALRPGGWVVLSLDHPFGRPFPGQSGGYFDAELVADTWEKAGVEVTQFFWRRPLGAVVRAFTAAGFLIEGVAEARPSDEALAHFPQELAVAADVPSFIAYRLRPAPRPTPDAVGERP
jgi:SAM-dependent methyltransferase